MKMNKINVLLLVLLAAFSFYLLATSIERVPAGEVEVVMEVGTTGTEIMLKPRPLVNPGKRAKWFFKQPKIPVLGVGYLKESFRLDAVMDFSTSFAFYTLDQVSGNQADRETVSACIIEGRIGRITDWELFISRLDPEKFNSDSSPYGIKYNDRAEILAEQIKYIIRSGNPESIYPGLSSGQGLPMTPGQKIDYWYQELISRRNFIIALKDRFNFTRPEQYLSFLRDDNPWYWGLGVQRYETLLNQARDAAEYLQSPFSEGLTARGYAGRYINDEDYLLLLNMIRRADSWQHDMLNTEDSILELQKQFNELQERINTGADDPAYLLYKGYLDNLNQRKHQILDIMIDELNSDFVQYINTEVYERLITAVRKEKLEQTVVSLADYKREVINNLNLDLYQLSQAERLINYIKKEYAYYWESDNWENFTTTFTNELNSLLTDNPEIILPGEAVFQTVYFELLDYYLDQVAARYELNENESSDLLRSLLPVLLENPAVLNSNRAVMSDLIYDYLTIGESSPVKTAGNLVSLYWNLEHQKEQQRRLVQFRESILVPFFSHHIESENRADSEELWTAVIEDVLEGEDLSVYQAYLYHDVEVGDTLESLSGLYGVDGKDFLIHANSMIEFQQQDDQNLYNNLYSFRNIESIYQQVRKKPLKDKSLITFYTVPPYTPDWWEARTVDQNQREVIIRRFVYPWIDAHLPEAFEEFVASSPYIEYLENLFGISLSELTLHLEKRSVFSNPRIRQIDPDFAGVYNND